MANPVKILLIVFIYRCNKSIALDSVVGAEFMSLQPKKSVTVNVRPSTRVLEYSEYLLVFLVFGL